MNFSDSIDFLSDFDKRQLARFPNFHHSSPLTFFPQRHIINFYGGRDVKRIPLIVNACDQINKINDSLGFKLKLTDDPCGFYTFALYASNCDLTCFSTEDTHNRLEFSIRIAQRQVESDLRGLSESHPALKGLQSIKISNDNECEQVISSLSKLFEMRQFLVKVRNKIQFNHVNSLNRETVSLSHVGITVYVIRELILIVLDTDRQVGILINYDQWLMMTDTISCRLQTKLTCKLNDLRKWDDLPSWETIRQIYKWGDDMLISCGLDAYAVIGEFESIVTGVFASFENTDVLGLGDDFLLSLLSTAKETYTEYGIPVYWTENLLILLREVSSVNQLSEIFGLRKHWGNPMVEADLSGKAVQEKLNEMLPIKGSSLFKLVASFNRMISMSFIEQHGEWPKCEFLSIDRPYPLQEAWLRNVTRIPEKAEGHDHFHWALQRFDCNCIIGRFEDQLALVGDKSVSVYRKHLDSVYVRGLMTDPPTEHPPESRRLILELLRRSHIPILDLLKIVMCNATPPEWLANSASMKGTEMKHRRARIFAVLTYELRQYFAVTEEIIKDHVFRYNPHQTMTMSEQELLGRLRQVTRQMDPTSPSRYLSVMHIIDFSKWNLRMNYDNTCLVFKSIDDFLGTPGLIERSHPLFEQMVNLVQDAFNPPQARVSVTENDTIWRFHRAGWEGQRQKGWTVLTSALLSDLERMTGVQSIICGQGDNQTLLSKFPIPESYRNPLDWIIHDKTGIRQLLDSFYHLLEKECLDVGLKVKTAESCRSLNYFNYGKRLYFNGIELSMTLKRISKIVSEPNESYPTTENILKTVEGAAFAAGLFSHPSVWPYFISRVCLLQTLFDSFTNNPLTGSEGLNHLARHGLTFDGRFFSILTKIPASLGGAPHLTLPSYLYRGHPDPVCSDFVGLKLRSKIGCEASRRILTLSQMGKWYNLDKSDRTSLILAPFSLNLKIPKSAKTPLVTAVAPALRAACKNPDLTSLFSIQTEAYETALLRSLSTMEPFQPTVANDIFSRTIPGHKQRFVSGLQNTTSLGRLIYESMYDPIAFAVARLESKQLLSWVEHVVDISSTLSKRDIWTQSHNCLVQKSRELSWGTTIVGVTVPHPLEQFCITTATYDRCSNDCSNLCPEHLVFVRHSDQLIYPPDGTSAHISCIRSRSGQPYLGNTISEGLIQKQLVCVNPTSAWLDAIRLNIVRLWTAGPDSNLDKLISLIIETRTDTPLNVINLVTGRPSRLSYNHRATLLSTIKSCASSTTTNMSSRIYVSSNRMGEYSHGEFNYHMPFGPSFLNFQSLLCLDEILKGTGSWKLKERELFHAHVRTDDVPLVYDSLIEINPLQTRFRFENIPIALFTPREKLDFRLFEGVTHSNIWHPPNRASTRDAKLGYGHQLIGNSFVSETVLKEFVTSEIKVSFSSRDAPIAIGDVSLVGVENLVHVLASNFLLMTSTQALLHADQGSFLVVALDIINTFSDSFWQQFAQPLSAPRHLATLAKLEESLSFHDITKSPSGLIPLLKVCVCRQMWRLWRSIFYAIARPNSSMAFHIYAPNLLSARLLWSKLIELCVHASGSYAYVDQYEILAFARDFSANIHSTSLGDLGTVMTRVQADFVELSKFLETTEPLFIPKIKVFSLIEPWVDKIRRPSSNPASTQGSNDRTIKAPGGHYPKAGLIYEYEPAEYETLISSTGCNCLPVRSPIALHQEAFFLPTGLLSKSHYKFLDIIYMFRLDIHGVVCVGSSTGTEALGIAVHIENKIVYVSCLHALTSFPPHSAGSFIPSAFVGHEAQQKLLAPSSAPLTGGDLSDDNCILAIVDNMRGVYFTGLTCDLESNQMDILTFKTVLFQNLLKIARMASPTLKWLIVKAPLKCRHEAEILATLLGCHFHHVRLVQSIYSRPGSRLCFFVAWGTSVSLRSFLPVDNEVSMRLAGDRGLTDFISSLPPSPSPPVASLPRSIQLSRKVVSTVLHNSFTVACYMYLKGWGLQYDSVPDKDKFFWDLEALISTLQEQVKDVIETFNRVFLQRPLTRSMILQVDSVPLHKRLNSTFLLMNRASLLRSLLVEDHINLELTSGKILHWLSIDHSYPLRTRTFTVRVNTTRFITNYSRYLFEILGHIYGCVHESPATLVKMPIMHHISAQPLKSRLLPSPFILSLTVARPIVNLSWRWVRRAEVLFSLFVHQNRCRKMTKVCVPHGYLVEDVLSSYEPVIQLEVFQLDQLTQVKMNALWIPDGKSVVDFLYGLDRSDDVFLVVDFLEMGLVSTLMNVVNTIRLPWLGILPSRVALQCRFEPPLINLVGLFPFTMELVNTSSPEGLRVMGCGCVDCTGEAIILEHFQMQSFTLDKVCSLKRIESVMDRFHR